MKQITASEMKNNIGKCFDLLLLEKELEVVRHGRVIAKLTAVPPSTPKNDKSK